MLKTNTQLHENREITLLRNSILESVSRCYIQGANAPESRKLQEARTALGQPIRDSKSVVFPKSPMREKRYGGYYRMKGI